MVASVGISVDTIGEIENKRTKQNRSSPISAPAKAANLKKIGEMGEHLQAFRIFWRSRTYSRPEKKRPCKFACQ